MHFHLAHMVEIQLELCGHLKAPSLHARPADPPDSILRGISGNRERRDLRALADPIAYTSGAMNRRIDAIHRVPARTSRRAA